MLGRDGIINAGSLLAAFPRKSKGSRASEFRACAPPPLKNPIDAFRPPLRSD